MKKTKLICMLLVCLFLFARKVNADIGPSFFSTESGVIQPGNQTSVEMRSEKVVFSNLTWDEYFLSYRYNVRADFEMVNTGNKKENVKVSFPIKYSDMISSYGGREDRLADAEKRITNITILADGKKQEFEVVKSDLDGGVKNLELIFNLIFDSQKTTVISVNYNDLGVVEGYNDEYIFNYILNSGAGWKNFIQKGEIIFNLPYSETNPNIIKLLGGLKNQTLINNNQVVINFSDLEPKEEDDVSISLYNPKDWNKYTALRAKAQKNITDKKSQQDFIEFLSGNCSLERYASDFRLSLNEEYFDAIDNLLKIKYVNKDNNLAYYNEASDDYSNSWHMIGDGKCDVIYIDIQKIVSLRNELEKSRINTTQEARDLVKKIDLNLFLFLVNELQFKSGENGSPVLDEDIKKEILSTMGEKYANNQDFFNLVKFSSQNGSYYSEETSAWFDQFWLGDFSYLKIEKIPEKTVSENVNNVNKDVQSPLVQENNAIKSSNNFKVLLFMIFSIVAILAISLIFIKYKIFRKK